MMTHKAINLLSSSMYKYVYTVYKTNGEADTKELGVSYTATVSL